MLIYTLTTGKGGRPQTFLDIKALFQALETAVLTQAIAHEPGKIIIEVKPEGGAK